MTAAIDQQTPAAQAEANPVGATPPRRQVERVVLLLLLAMAGACASFAARNSDVWLHRATGRLLIEGQYRFGVDPFGQDTAGRYWANHAWLYDAALYVVWEVAGGGGAVAVKAGLVVVLAWLLWRLGRFWGNPWVAGTAALLAIAAMSPRLLLQPMILSLLGLAVVLRCCQRGSRWLWGIPLVTALWVNLDSWFFLGPLVALLEVVRPRQSEEGRRPWAVMLATLVATLCSPHLWQAWTWPVELSPAVWRSAWVNDPRLSGLFNSPWRWTLLGRGDEIYPAGWALLLLAVWWLTAVAIAVYRRRIDLYWLLGVLLFALAAWQVRLVPLWAVVAVPLASRAAARWTCCGSWAQLPMGGTVGLAIILLGLAVSGYLHGPLYRERMLAWVVYEHPGLRRLAEVLQQRHEQAGGAESLFTTHPDVAHYLAWFAPQVRSSYDSRLALFTDRADEYRQLLQDLGLVPAPADGPETAASKESPNSWVAVLYDPDRGRWSAALEHIRRTEAGWRPLCIAGGELLLQRGLATEEDWQQLLRQDWGNEELRPGGEGPATLALPEPWWRLSWPRSRQGLWQAEAARVYVRLQELSAEDHEPLAALLAVRAARCALEQDAADAFAWLLAARSVQMLARHPWESTAAFPPLEQVRQVQFRAALVQAIRRQPELLTAYQSLALIWEELAVWDLAFEHARAALRLLQRSGPAAGEPESAYQQRLEQWQERTMRLERQFRDNENRFVLRSVGLAGQPLARARLAAQLGLYDTALEVLQSASPALYGSEGVVLLLELLTQTGRVAEAALLLEQEQLRQQPLRLGLYQVPLTGSAGGTFELPAGYWFELVTAAAAGRYRQALQAALAIREFLRQERERLQPQALPDALAQTLAGEIGLSIPLGGQLALRWLGAWKSLRLRELYEQAAALCRADGDFALLGGLLALEAGDLEIARQAFIHATDAYHENRKAVGRQAPGSRLLERYQTLVP